MFVCVCACKRERKREREREGEREAFDEELIAKITVLLEY